MENEKEAVQITELESSQEQGGADTAGGDPLSKKEADTASEQPSAEGKTEKTFTQAELDAIIDKRIARERASFDKQLTEKLSEAQKLAKMNAEQKAQYEKEQAEKRLAEREATITRRELIAAAKETLAGKGLPIGLAEILDCSSAEKCNESIEAVAKAFNSAVTKAVNDKLRGTPPKTGEAQTKDPFLEGLGL